MNKTNTKSPDFQFKIKYSNPKAFRPGVDAVDVKQIIIVGSFDKRKINTKYKEQELIQKYDFMEECWEF